MIVASCLPTIIIYQGLAFGHSVCRQYHFSRLPVSWMVFPAKVGNSWLPPVHIWQFCGSGRGGLSRWVASTLQHAAMLHGHLAQTDGVTSRGSSDPGVARFFTEVSDSFRRFQEIFYGNYRIETCALWRKNNLPITWHGYLAYLGIGSRIGGLRHNMGVCKNPASIRLVFHDPPWAFTRKNDKRKKKNDNVERWFC